MELYGRATQRIDDKNRVVVPDKFRDALGSDALAGGLIVTKGFEGCLFVFPRDRWKQAVDELAGVHYTRKKGRLLKRFFLEGAERRKVDKTGRIVVPDHLRQYAGLTEQALFIGVLDRIEIWDPGRWAALQEQHMGEYEELAEDFHDYLEGRAPARRAETGSNPEAFGEAGSPQ